MTSELESALATAREMETARENVIEGALAMHETDMDAVQRATHRSDAAYLLRAKIEALEGVQDDYGMDPESPIQLTLVDLRAAIDALPKGGSDEN